MSNRSTLGGYTYSTPTYQCRCMARLSSLRSSSSSCSGLLRNHALSALPASERRANSAHNDGHGPLDNEKPSPGFEAPHSRPWTARRRRLDVVKVPELTGAWLRFQKFRALCIRHPLSGNSTGLVASHRRLAIWKCRVQSFGFVTILATFQIMYVNGD